MKITKIKHWTDNLGLTRPYTIAYKTISAVELHFVRIDVEDGSFGLGSASPGSSVTGEGIDDGKKAFDAYLESLLLGEDIRCLKSLSRKLQTAMVATPAAQAAVDTALYDLMAQYLKLPLADMLGRVYQALPTSVTIGIQSTEDSLKEAEEYLGRGFRILKVKTGKSLEEDLERLHKIREKAGRQTTIRVDANKGYSVHEFKEFIQKSEPLDIEFIEQPLKAGDIESMRSLPDAVRAKTAADESLLDAGDALELTRAPRPFGIYNIKLMKCGGISSALQIADIAQIAGIDLMWGCNDESIISITAALHAALAAPATRYLDLDGSLDLARDLVDGGFVLKDGMMSVTDKPGLGVVLK